MKRAREEGQEIIVLSLRERRRSHKTDWLWIGYNRPTAIAPEGRRRVQTGAGGWEIQEL